MRALALVGLVAAACTPVPASWVLASGQPQPPIAECTTLHLRRIPVAEAERRYQRVGVVCLGVQGARSTAEIESTPGATSVLRERACSLGGDIVVPSGYCSITPAVRAPVAYGAVEYAVFRGSVGDGP